LKTHRKSLLAIYLFIAAAIVAQAQPEHSFEKGKIYLNAGVGYPNQNALLLKPISKELNFTYEGRGPYHFKAEYGILDNLGIGISLNRVGFDARFKIRNEELAQLFDYYLTYNSTSALIRLNGHLPAAPGLDIYGGLGFGIKTGRPRVTSDDPLKKSFAFPFAFPIGFEATIGARIRVYDPVYLYVETGLAKSFVQGGLSIRIF